MKNRSGTRAAAWCAAAFAGLLMQGCAAPAQAAKIGRFDPVQPVMDCAAVPGLDLSGVTDGSVTVASATVVTTGVAPYCEVRGTISPANTFIVRLPTQGWTQRYVQTGCGGLCGNANIDFGKGADCQPVKDGTVASATTDMGHQGPGSPMGSWAAANPQAQIDFAWRGVHATSQVAKALIARFYGRAQQTAYFIGCSDGGREALMEAQRYPEDFDGIVAGAPAANMVVQNTYHHGWNVMANKYANGQYILLASKLPMLHEAVLRACDGVDGLADGLIDDPRRCHFDPASIVCTPGQDTSTCLTPAEAEVVRKLHDGATDAQGHFLEQKGSHPWGSELLWTLFVPSAQGQTVFSESIAVLPFARYLAYYNTASPNWQLTDLKFDADGFWKTVQTSAYLSATDPDLSAFRQRGGKLLLWHGWNDQHIPASATLNYWRAMETTMGRPVVDSFARLYLLPGVGHCGGGEGPDSIDLLSEMMAWVERGNAPYRVVASKVVDGAVTRSRPVYPYPKVARYGGTGSIDDAANFVAYRPPVESDGDFDYGWMGRQLYSHGYQAACTAQGTELVCVPSQLPFGRGTSR
ncbi:tannase/feruloyl esterase family alpha/beta hydrolase [Ideonella sp. DXS29W]|uniref:Tannase/feruloyl esterase family alpha/beta hydrolase n=1 Tax=Ideonella lacteola TaxID=2984193 RepID=A0ABU9BI87_9BURK